MTELYNVIGSRGYDQLLSDPQGADVIAINCTPGKGEVKRGTVMFREATGLYAPASSAEVVSTNNLVILNEDVDTGDAAGSGEPAVAPDAAAYRAGRFVDGRVTLKEDEALTAAHKVILRMQGIVFKPTADAEEFDNSVSGD